MKLSQRHRHVPVGLFLGLLAGSAVALTTQQATAPQKAGGIVPTESRHFVIEPGPEPDVVFFATGECLGKIEPCG